MIEKLIFEYCKANGSSTLIDLGLNGDKYVLKTASGRNGMYLDSSFKYYECSAANMKPITDSLQALSIYKWSRYYPATYICIFREISMTVPNGRHAVPLQTA